MNRSALFVAVMIAACFAVVSLGAGPQAGGGMGLQDMPVGLGYRPLPPDAESYIKIIDPVANLTDEQKKSINDAFNEMTIEFAESNLKSNGHPDFAQLHAISKKYQERIEKVLTPAQVKLLKEADVTNLIKALARPAQLTEGQIKAIKGTVDCSDINALRQAIADILTPEQKAVFNKGRAISYVKSHYWNAKLTDEQFKKVEEAADQLAKNSSLSDVELADKIKEKIDPLLTPEQKKVMQPLEPAGGTGLGPKMAPGP